MLDCTLHLLLDQEVVHHSQVLQAGGTNIPLDKEKERKATEEEIYLTCCAFAATGWLLITLGGAPG